MVATDGMSVLSPQLSSFSGSMWLSDVSVDWNRK